MRLSRRSYPHPVVGNGDDVPGVAFQNTFDFSSDPQYFYINVTIACSSSTLNRLVAKDSASHVVHVECSNTLFRKAYDFKETEKRLQIPSSLLNDEVQVNALIRAKKDIPKYKIDGAHPDYEDAAFDIRAGDILAVGEGQTFDAENSYDSLRRVGAIMVIEESAESGDHPMKVDYNSDKIRILLAKSDFKTYSKLKQIPALTSHLTTTIVLPVLLDALHLIEAEDASVQGCNWYRNLETRIQTLELEGEKDVLSKAQKLLDMPIRRALAAAESYAGGVTS